MPEKITIYFDGACEPVNPEGTAAYGFVIYRGDERIKEGCGIIGTGRGMTSNLGEYTAVIKALTYLKEQGLTTPPVRVRGDSQLVINQIDGSWQVHSPRIEPLLTQAENLARDFEDIHFEWVPRKQNNEADLLSKKAYLGEVQEKREERAKRIKEEEVKVFPDHYEVRGYNIPKDLSSCTCKDWRKRCRKYGMLCKHQIYIAKFLQGRKSEDKTTNQAPNQRNSQNQAEGGPEPCGIPG